MPQPETAQIWVLTVDDDRRALDPVRRYLASAHDIHIIAEARSGREALERMDSLTFDVMLVDSQISEMNELALLHETQLRPDPPTFIAVSTLDDHEIKIEVLSGFEAGRIIRNAQAQEVIAAFRETTLGTFMPAGQLIDYLPHLYEESGSPLERAPTRSDSLLDTLSETESLILHHLCEGLSNADIARATEYSEATVKKYVSQMISRFGVTSRLSLAVTVIRARLNQASE